MFYIAFFINFFPNIKFSSNLESTSPPPQKKSFCPLSYSLCRKKKQSSVTVKENSMAKPKLSFILQIPRYENSYPQIFLLSCLKNIKCRKCKNFVIQKYFSKFILTGNEHLFDLVSKWTQHPCIFPKKTE